jgi:hypothetical protein
MQNTARFHFCPSWDGAPLTLQRCDKAEPEVCLLAAKQKLVQLHKRHPNLPQGNGCHANKMPTTRPGPPTLHWNQRCIKFRSWWSRRWRKGRSGTDCLSPGVASGNQRRFDLLQQSRWIHHKFRPGNGRTPSLVAGNGRNLPRFTPQTCRLVQ